MATQLLGIKTRFTDDAGQPLIGGEVHSYAAGTSMPLATYKDAALTIENTNPVILDDTGSADIFLKGVYRIRVLDASGVFVEEQDDVSQLESTLLADVLIGIVTSTNAALNESINTESRRATAAEVAIDGKVDTEILRAKESELTAQVLLDAEVLRAKERETQLDVQDASLQSQISSIGGGKKAYTTYALMVAGKEGILPNSSVDVTNDVDTLKNGSYAYDGTTFTKSVYDPLTLAKNYTDAAKTLAISTASTDATVKDDAMKSLILSKVASSFSTKALMTASALPAGSYAEVMDDSIADNNGNYENVAGVWTYLKWNPLAQAKAYADGSAKFKIKRLSALDSMDIRVEGDYTLSSNAIATALNAPESTAGLLRVRGEDGTLLRTYNILNSDKEYVSHSNGASAASESFVWSAFTLKVSQANIESAKTEAVAEADIQSKAYTDSVSYNDKGRLTTQNLDSLLDKGIWICNSSSSATLALNYPWEGVPCVITNKVTAITPTILQVAETIEATRKRTATRRYNGTAWGQWNKGELVEAHQLDASVTNRITTRAEWLFPDDCVLSFDTTTRVLSWNRTIMCLTSAVTQNRVNFNSASISLVAALDYSVVYLDLTLVPQDGSSVTDPTTCIKVGNYNVFKDDINKVPLVKVRTNTGKAVSCSGFLPVVNSSGGGTVTSDGSNLIEFEKTATALTFYVKGAKTNLIKHQLVRTTTPAIQLDNWGMNTAIEVDADKNNVKALTSNGVWECALKDTANLTDHSGGSHGDELRTSAFFMIDGVYKAEDSILSGKAKEIKFIQKSVIYAEDSLVKIADRQVEWTYTFDKLNIKQSVTPVAGRTFSSTWMLMLPVLRKSNTNNTGAQITDKEIRNTDWTVIDVSEPDFERREQEANNGDFINLSGQVSGVSATVKLNTVVSPNPMHFVQNNVQFNKIYLAARTINTSALIAADEKWFVDADIIINTIN